MSISPNEPLLLHEDNVFTKLFQAAIDTQKNLIVLMHNNTPILLNKAFQNFTGMHTAREFLREFGSLPSRFVPHDAYFHENKCTNPDEWITELQDIPEVDRIVSMINYRAEPHAFSVTLESPVDEYVIISFTDISQELIKRIMIENDVTIDKESGAYDKDYFIHTLKSYQDAALFNRKSVALTLIELVDADSNLIHFIMTLKANIRQSDMLIRWGKKSFLLAYLIDLPETTLNIVQKVRQKSPCTIRLATAVQQEHEPIHEMIYRVEKLIKESVHP
jgi:hypothetical protein